MRCASSAARPDTPRRCDTDGVAIDDTGGLSHPGRMRAFALVLGLVTAAGCSRTFSGEAVQPTRWRAERDPTQLGEDHDRARGHGARRARSGRREPARQRPPQPQVPAAQPGQLHSVSRHACGSTSRSITNGRSGGPQLVDGLARRTTAAQWIPESIEQRRHQDDQTMWDRAADGPAQQVRGTSSRSKNDTAGSGADPPAPCPCSVARPIWCFINVTCSTRRPQAPAGRASTRRGVQFVWRFQDHVASE